MPDIQPHEIEDKHVRTISDADAKAIARVLLAEASKQVLMATGRGVWSTLKALAFPLLIGLILWWQAAHGKLIELPTQLPQKV